MITAVVALRISTHGQADGFGIDAQRDLVQRFVDREQIRVVEWITDEISGTTAIRKRPGGRRLYEFIDGKRKAEAVIFPRLDRATRDEDAIEIHEVRRDVRNAGMRLAYANTGWADLSLRGSVIDHVGAVYAAEERQLIVARMRAGKTQKARSGRIVGSGRAPYWCDRVGARRDVELVINAERAGWLRKAALRVIKGASCDTACTWLQEHGAPAPGTVHGLSSRGWWQYTLLKMFRSPALRGEFRSAGETIQRDDLRVLSDEEWHAVQRSLDRNARYARRNRRQLYLLSSHICCACGRAMVGRTVKSGIQYYLCTSYNNARRHTKKCGMLHVRASAEDGVDARVWRALSEWLNDPEGIRQSVERHNARLASANAPLTDELALVETSIADATRKLESLAASLERVSDRARAAIESRMAAADARIAELEATRDKLKEQIARAGAAVDETRLVRLAEGMRLNMASATFERKRAAIIAMGVVLHMRTEADGYVTVGALDDLELEI